MLSQKSDLSRIGLAVCSDRSGNCPALVMSRPYLTLTPLTTGYSPSLIRYSPWAIRGSQDWLALFNFPPG